MDDIEMEANKPTGRKEVKTGKPTNPKVYTRRKGKAYIGGVQQCLELLYAEGRLFVRRLGLGKVGLHLCLDVIAWLWWAGLQ